GLPVPICDKSEQEEIVRRVEAALSWINRLVSEAATARNLVDHLDKAVLAKAFRGELVPQDPNDEPASVLLEHIREQRTATSSAGRVGANRTKRKKQSFDFDLQA